MRITESFYVDAPIGVVWDLLGDLARVARHVPGARLTGLRDDGRYDGEIAVAFGPRTVCLKGPLSYGVDPAMRRGTLEGIGADARGNSRAIVRGTFSASEAAEATRVDVEIDLTFSGALAEFGYTGARHVARGLIGEFCSSVAAELNGEGPAALRTRSGAAPLTAGKLVRTAVGEWLRRKS